MQPFNHSTTPLASPLQRQWSRYATALKRCQRDFSEPSIHDSRIEARRVAAQLDLLKNFAPGRAIARAKKSIKRHLDTFDRLRDAQVQMAIITRECSRIPGARVVGKLIAKRERKCRRTAKRRIRRVTIKPARRVIEMLVERLRKSGHGVAARERELALVLNNVESAFARVAECRRRMTPSDPRTVHRTRIAFKRFRYMMEAMQPIVPGITPRRLASMKAFQDLLGDFQDTEVFLARTDKLVAANRVEAAEVAPLREWLVRRHARQLQRCLRRADVVFKFWPPTDLSSAAVA